MGAAEAKLAHFSAGMVRRTPEFPAFRHENRASLIAEPHRLPHRRAGPAHWGQAAGCASRLRSRVAVAQVTMLQAAAPQRMSVSATTAGKSFNTDNPVSAQVA